MPSANSNIARHLALMATAHPGQAAIKIPRGRGLGGKIKYLTLTFTELDAEVDAWCTRLMARGVRRGDRTLVMVSQGLPLIASVFALFKIGAVPVVIDPGMGRELFLACVERSHPRVLIGTPLARLASHIFKAEFRSVKVRVPASGSLTARLAGKRRGDRYATSVAAPTELAAILFTSGSTGSPKGVRYEHGMFEAQIQLLRETYRIEPGEIDLPLLPIFALFNPALGTTTIVPEIDPRRPAEIDPAKIVQAIRQENVTTSFGSPTLWRKIGDYCVTNKLTLPTMHRVLCAGAPVPAQLWESSRQFLPIGQLHSPYGATEALPVSSISSDEIATVSGLGACVGRPIAGLEVKIIAPTDEPIATIVETRELPVGEIGEIIVRGPVVTKSYDEMPPATTAAKITYVMNFSTTGVWHRMGDCGYLDDAGRLWFCGRKAERVETATGPLHTEPCEQVFRVHPRAERCALIGLGAAGQQRPALVVEAKIKNAADAAELVRALYTLGQQHAHTQPIKTFFFRPKFPVDVRHNAKIHRLALARWAATAVPYETETES